MDDADDRNAARSKSAVHTDERRMCELVLEDDVAGQVRHAPGCTRREAGRQLAAVAGPGQLDDVHRVSVCLQVLDESPVVEIAPGRGVEAAADEEADAR